MMSQTSHVQLEILAIYCVSKAIYLFITITKIERNCKSDLSHHHHHHQHHQHHQLNRAKPVTRLSNLESECNMNVQTNQKPQALNLLFLPQSSLIIHPAPENCVPHMLSVFLFGVMDFAVHSFASLRFIMAMDLCISF